MKNALTTLLIVDDTAENLIILGDLLQQNYRVLAANTGKRALELAARDPKPDLILLDVMMPEMDGYAVLERLKANQDTQDIPVIFVTALDAKEDEQRGLSLGAVDYITKPLSLPIVLARVATQLELKQVRDRLRDQNAYLEAEVSRRVAENELILTSAGEGIYGTDTSGVVNFINPAAAAMLGYQRTELLGCCAYTIIHHSRADGSQELVEEFPLYSTLNAGLTLCNQELTIWRKDGKPLAVEFSSTPMLKDGVLAGAVATFQDISERKAYVAQLEHQSNYDDLTGLPNRNLLRDRLSHAIERCLQDDSTLAVLLLNLDRFKEINDALGHDVGDLALRQLARRLQDTLEDVDTLARVAGDEFVVVAEAGEATASLVAQTLLNHLSEPSMIDGREFFFPASIGIAVFPKDGDEQQTLLKNASAAMYKAKAAGGNVFRFYEAEMNARSMERLELGNALRRALERDELLLCYQPQVNLRNGEIVGCEALLRWQRPGQALLQPGVFIPLAEEMGLIVSLGEWVLYKACTQNKVWQDAGLPSVTVAVNLSAHQFANQDVVALTEKVLLETGLDPKFLELELTESAVMADAEAFILATEKLKKLGVTLSIDDFGTGFSSLSYLKRFALDRLKIDLSFVRDITQDSGSASVALAIIALAHNLNLSVIAEGVETEAQMTLLRCRGCDDMQGYYFSKPVPAEEFEQMLREGRKLSFDHCTEPARTILLVDDDPNTLASLARLLRHEGYEVAAVQSGLAGLERLACQKMGVVIADYRMARMNGAEFLARVREIHPDSVRIMLTGYTDLNVVTDSVNSGELFRFVTKPWDNTELLETVRQAFRRYESRCRQLNGLTLEP